MFYYFSLMSKINRRQFYLFSLYIVPYIQFGPVAYRECTNVLTFVNFSIVCVPQFGPLQFGIPLPEFISHRKYSFLGSCLFFVSSCAADQCIKFELFNNIKEGIGL